MVQQLKTLPSWLNEAAQKTHGILWQVVKSYQSNQRQGTVGVKTRSAVVSTGKKPYKQKKTGNARRGSFVSPLHVGGGVAHGPKMRKYLEVVSPNLSRVAVKLALAKKMQAGFVFSGAVNFESGKTKDAFKALKSALPQVGQTIICLDNPSEKTLRAVRNIRGVSCIPASQLNALHIIECRSLVISEGALKALESRVSK